MATVEEPLLKRKRDEPAVASGADPVRSDIWYDDGNVILSSVFKDMFSFPQPPSMDSEMMDGCPIVQLSDSAKEVGYVLEGIFERK
ncbi:hypothetical protein HWV62_19573 [Athelia sp. TMB]|nr:hypothetical protein HWV62_19573 [Athelia sp. TMB]